MYVGVLVLYANLGGDPDEGQKIKLQFQPRRKKERKKKILEEKKHN